jgi:hypothetical protein
MPPTVPALTGFLSDHESRERVVKIRPEPEVIYFEEGRSSRNLNFDFVIEGLTEREITLRFIKVGVYDENGSLLTFKHVNHNAVGTAGIHTLGKYTIKGKELLDIFNPFHSFPLDLPIHSLRYMFTLADSNTKEEFYYGNVVVHPIHYEQKVILQVPMKGLLTILDGHDFYSHHRRFAMSLVRQVTNHRFTSNFSRYGLDFTIIGPDGNTRKMAPGETSKNYDFHFRDARDFYTDQAVVLSPAGGTVVRVVDDLDDLYDTPFDMDAAIAKDAIEEVAGNYITIKHNDREYSHLFHLLKSSAKVSVGDEVESGQELALVGFSGSSTVYSHLHYQLMDGPDFLADNALPCRFSNVTLVYGDRRVRHEILSIDTGDFVLS